MCGDVGCRLGDVAAMGEGAKQGMIGMMKALLSRPFCYKVSCVTAYLVCPQGLQYRRVTQHHMCTPRCSNLIRTLPSWTCL